MRKGLIDAEAFIFALGIVLALLCFMVVNTQEKIEMPPPRFGVGTQVEHVAMGDKKCVITHVYKYEDPVKYKIVYENNNGEICDEIVREYELRKERP